MLLCDREVFSSRFNDLVFVRSQISRKQKQIEIFEIFVTFDPTSYEGKVRRTGIDTGYN